VGVQMPVRAGDVVFVADVAEGGGPQPVGLDEVLSFDGVRETIGAIAEQVAAAWQVVRPDEATVEFGLSLTTKTGKLTGLLVEGGGQASLRVVLSWRGDGPAG
jgi:hypothetical protein